MDGESCDWPSNKRVPANMEFKVANEFWKVVIFLHFDLHHLYVYQMNNNSIAFEQGDNISFQVMKTVLFKSLRFFFFFTKLLLVCL